MVPTEVTEVTAAMEVMEAMEVTAATEPAFADRVLLLSLTL